MITNNNSFLKFVPYTVIGIPRKLPRHTQKTASGAIGQPPKLRPHPRFASNIKYRTSFFSGSAPILEFLIEKWKKEKNYKLRKELFAFNDNKIAVQFWYEYQDAYDEMKWKRCYGLEDWTFSTDGRNCKRQMSANDIEISDEERWFKDGVDINEVDISEEHW